MVVIGSNIFSSKLPQTFTFRNYTLVVPNIAGWKMDPDWVDDFPLKNGDIPASYVGLPEGIIWTVVIWRSIVGSLGWEIIFVRPCCCRTTLVSRMNHLCGCPRKVWDSVGWSCGTLPETLTVRPQKWMELEYDPFPMEKADFQGRTVVM